MADQGDLARELLGLAADDLTAARALVDVPSVSDAIVGFHAQQAAEKALKAALAASGRSFPFTHNIALLMQLCEDADIELQADLDQLDLLTRTAWVGATARVLPAPWTGRLRWIWRRRRWRGRGRQSTRRLANTHAYLTANRPYQAYTASNSAQASASCPGITGAPGCVAVHSRTQANDFL
jgi:HEPN domain-containing protein